MIQYEATLNCGLITFAGEECGLVSIHLRFDNFFSAILSRRGRNRTLICTKWAIDRRNSCNAGTKIGHSRLFPFHCVLSINFLTYLGYI